MPKYLLTYHGGGMPETPAESERVMALWNTWMGGLGAALIDGGNPTGASRTIGANGAIRDGGGANPTTGYSLIEANDLDEATSLSKSCPILGSGGSIEVGELLEM